jgi:hypothetical protein
MKLGIAKEEAKSDLNISRMIEMDSVGNLPYYPHSIVRKVRHVLEGIQNIKIQEDEHAIYVKVGNGVGNLVVIETHLDHPGYVIDEKGMVASVGSLYDSEMVQDMDITSAKPVSFYTPAGEYVENGEMYEIKANGSKLTAKVKTASGKKLPTNTQVLPNVETGLVGKLLHLRSVDNLATTEVCLSLIEKLSVYTGDQNVTFIFSKLEEVAQITATGISLMGASPFESLDHDTIFFILEAAPVCSGDVADGGKLAVAVAESGISLDPQGENLANQTIMRTADDLGFDIEQVDLHSHSDAISYQLVGCHPHVSCLLVNSKNRHNVDESGDFAAEIVHTDSLTMMEQVIMRAIEMTQSTKFNRSEGRGLSEKEQKKKKQLIRSYRWAQPRLILEKLYPDNITENLICKLSSLIGRTYPQ